LLKKGVKEVKVFFKVEDIPENIMKLILSTFSYSVEESRKLDDGSFVFIAKRKA